MSLSFEILQDPRGGAVVNFIKRHRIVSFLMCFAVAVIASMALLQLISWSFRPDLPSSVQATYTPEEIARVEELRSMELDLDNPPVIYREVDYSEGPAAAWYPKHEAPILVELVKEGKLPPLEERVPREPVVLEGVDGIGNYGGTWHRLTPDVFGWEIAHYYSYTALLRFSPQGLPLVPHLAKSWTVSPDNREFVFTLRKGTKWSDGHPFTADDILYWWQHEICDEKVIEGPPTILMVKGKRGTIEKLGPYTIKFTFPEPNGLFLLRLATWEGFWGMLNTPVHYLSRYHPTIGDKELIDRTMKARRMTDPLQLYRRLKHPENPEHPRLWPWVYHTFSPDTQTYVRNPYYWAVDTEGNQLPYLDRIRVKFKSREMYEQSLADGEASMQRCWRNDLYTLFMSQREKGDYEVYHWYPGDRSDWVISPNLNRRIDPDDPSSKWKHQLLNDKRFRRALSLAIDRQEIIEAEFDGVTEPCQVDPGPQSLFHEPSLYNSFVECDPVEANRLLDELGLSERDYEGCRTFPDGSRMTFFLTYFGTASKPGAGHFVVDHWRKVGVRTMLQERNRGLFYVEKESLKPDFTVWSSSSEFIPLMDPRTFIPFNHESNFALGYGLWYREGGLYGNPAVEGRPGCIPVPEDHPLYAALLAYESVIAESEIEKQSEKFREVLKIAAENVWTINICSARPAIAVVKNGFRNVPRNLVWAWSFITPANGGVETFFLDDPSDSPATVAEIKKEIVEITPPPDMMAARQDGQQSGSMLTQLFRISFFGIAALIVVLVGIKHPYIGRRLLIMIPTLLIISIVTFIVIQLPPGDYITTLILQLQQRGRDSDIQLIESTREMFYLNKPVYVQYAYWMGLKWFITFDRADMGLLQGFLGNSMIHQQAVNQLVEDRIVLTLLVAFGTILLSWSIAIPIGIYSAVRQYSITDYLLTFLGFVGMCVPPFLLALVLMYISQRWFGVAVSGLFSPQYDAQPEWSWGKVIDLIRHIWVPIVVLGVSGTAWMIRVMRANLLDELKKPYVVTAMAKGVRPMKLLLKYPVRIALNPFISGIGYLFPQLISGGAIVAVILSLPTVGPLMLNGLMDEDMYMAGSMLMILSVLGVLGTLASDLLLLWLDPRIRFRGGIR